VCYVHAGDGVCENFEKISVVDDCGYFTPHGFTDQWPHRVTWADDAWTHCELPAAGPPIPSSSVGHDSCRLDCVVRVV
jgi:hypothetical protein